APGEDQFREAGLHRVSVREQKIAQVRHNAGRLTALVMDDGSVYPMTALYARLPFHQHFDILEVLGCEVNAAGFLVVDDFQRTTVPGVYAAGDNSSGMRAVSSAIAAGTMAGAMLNKELLG